jgi:hypothetical protein
MINAVLTLVVLTVMVAASLALYLLPVLICWVRRVPDFAPVAVINVLLGWTLVGWVIALAFALRPVGSARRLGPDARAGQRWPVPAPPGPVPSPDGQAGASPPRGDPPPLLLPPRWPDPWDSADYPVTGEPWPAGDPGSPAGSEDPAGQE